MPNFNFITPTPIIKINTFLFYYIIPYIICHYVTRAVGNRACNNPCSFSFFPFKRHKGNWVWLGIISTGITPFLHAPHFFFLHLYKTLYLLHSSLYTLYNQAFYFPSNVDAFLFPYMCNAPIWGLFFSNFYCILDYTLYNTIFNLKIYFNYVIQNTIKKNTFWIIQFIMYFFITFWIVQSIIYFKI